MTSPQLNTVSADPAPRLLIVDDEDSMRRTLKRAIDEEPYAVLEASNGEAWA